MRHVYAPAHPVLLALLVLACILMLVSCGGASGGYAESPSTPVPADTGEPDAAWDAAKPAFARACTKCHNGSGHPLDLQRRAVVLAVKAKIKGRVSGGTMPPQGNAMTPVDKAAILAYVD